MLKVSNSLRLYRDLNVDCAYGIVSRVLWQLPRPKGTETRVTLRGRDFLSLRFRARGLGFDRGPRLICRHGVRLLSHRL